MLVDSPIDTANTIDIISLKTTPGSRMSSVNVMQHSLNGERSFADIEQLACKVKQISSLYDNLPTPSASPGVKIPLDVENTAFLQLPNFFTWEKARDPIHWITVELKRRSSVFTKDLLLPFRVLPDDTTLIYLITTLFCTDIEIHLTESDLLSILGKIDVPTLIQGLKFIWARLPFGGVVRRSQYNSFRKDEKKNNYPKNSFFTLLPKYLDSKAQASIVYDFFDLLKHITSQENDYYNDSSITPLEICKIFGIWALGDERLKKRHSSVGNSNSSKHDSLEITTVPELTGLQRGLKNFYPVSNALFHLYTSFLKHFNDENIPNENTLNNSLKCLLLDFDSPPYSLYNISFSITVPLVQLHTLQPSIDGWDLLNRCVNLIDYSKPENFITRENYALFKILFKNDEKNSRKFCKSFTDETGKIMNLLDEDKKSTIPAGWALPDENIINNDYFDDYLEISNQNIDPTFYWAWLSTLSPEETFKKKLVFGRALILKFDVEGMEKIILFEDTQLRTSTTTGTTTATNSNNITPVSTPKRQNVSKYFQPNTSSYAIPTEISKSNLNFDDNSSKLKASVDKFKLFTSLKHKRPSLTKNDSTIKLKPEVQQVKHLKDSRVRSVSLGLLNKSKIYLEDKSKDKHDKYDSHDQILQKIETEIAESEVSIDTDDSRNFITPKSSRPSSRRTSRNDSRPKDLSTPKRTTSPRTLADKLLLSSPTHVRKRHLTLIGDDINNVSETFWSDSKSNQKTEKFKMLVSNRQNKNNSINGNSSSDWSDSDNFSDGSLMTAMGPGDISPRTVYGSPLKNSIETYHEDINPYRQTTSFEIGCNVTLLNVQSEKTEHTMAAPKVAPPPVPSSRPRAATGEKLIKKHSISTRQRSRSLKKV